MYINFSPHKTVRSLHYLIIVKAEKVKNKYVLTHTLPPRQRPANAPPTPRQSRTQVLFNIEKRLIQDPYTDHLQIEQARKGAWGGRDGRGKRLAENDRYLDIVQDELF